MKKTSDITKYEPDWQILRAKIKGPMTTLEDKLRLVKFYFDRNRTVDAWERIVNWLQGLQMGYRASNDTPALERIVTELVWYNGIKPSSKELPMTTEVILKKLQQYPFKDRLLLWRDLFERNKKWLAKGYNHAEHNIFSDALWQTFVTNHENVPENFDKVKLDDLRKRSANLKNTHKFFF